MTRCPREACKGTIHDPDDDLGARCNLCNRGVGPPVDYAEMRVNGVLAADRNRKSHQRKAAHRVGIPESAFRLVGRMDQGVFRK